jgi:hypothetical protein
MFKRSVIIFIGLFIFLLGPLYTGSCEQAIAQKTLETAVNNDVVKELASEKVGVDASELLEHINATVKDGKRYINTMKTASDEDLLVLQLQFFSLQQRMINDVHKLTDAMLDQEKKGKQPELCREVEAMLTRITPSLWIHINRLRGEVDAVRARRIKAPVKERLAIENEVLKLTARLDKMYEMSLSHIIVGFALQDTLSNFASGIMILLYRPYDVGDLIDVSGVFGKVDKMNLVSASILTLDNQMIVIPNNKIWGDVIKNITSQDIRRVDMVFGIAYSDDVSKAETILNDILKSHDKLLDDPEPMVRLHTLGESSVDFVVRPWVKFDDYWDVYWHVTKAVKLRFDEDGISIPFPQRDVHVYNNSIATAGAGIT